MKMLVGFLSTAVLLSAVPLANAAEKNSSVCKSSDLINKTIKNKSGDHLGYLEDVVVELPSGRVVYSVLSTKNSLGLGGRLYAIPLSAFSPGENNKYLVLDVPKDEFEKAEGFDASKWPDRGDERWSKLGKKNAYQEDKDAKRVRLTSLNSLAIKNPSGTNLGSVQGFGVDGAKEQVVFAAMSHGGVVGIGAKYFAIPWQAMDLKALNLKVDDRSFVLDATPQDFENSAGFDTTAWPDRGNERFLKNAKKIQK